MTTLREAAQQALEALQFVTNYDYDLPYDKIVEACNSLEAALAEQDDDLTAAWMAGAAEERKRAEQPQPAYWGVFEGGNLHDFFTMREMAEEMAYYKGSHAVVGPIYTTPLAQQAEPVQEPVAWMVKDEGLYWTEEAAIRRADKFVEPLDVVPLYTTPPAPQPLRDLCAAAYQAVGVADGPVEMLDNLWAAAEGKPLPHDPGAGLPWSPPSPQPQQPLVWRYKPMVGAPWSLSDDGYYVSCKRDQGYIVEPLYAAPQPLSGLDVERLLEDVIGSLPVARKLVRTVEAEVLKRMGVGK